MDYPTDPRVARILKFVGLFEELARQSVLAGLKAYKCRHRVRRGATVRPGPETPLWNELARQALLHVRRRGDKANLGRVLGLPRQRIHQFLVDHSACPDAERTLLLLAWLQSRLAGGKLP